MGKCNADVFVTGALVRHAGVLRRGRESTEAGGHAGDVDLLVHVCSYVMRHGCLMLCMACGFWLKSATDPSDPHHRELQTILSRLEDDVLAPYVLPGNKLSRDM